MSVLSFTERTAVSACVGPVWEGAPSPSPLTVAWLLPGVALLAGVLLLVPRLLLGCALLVPRLLLAVLRVPCQRKTHVVGFQRQRWLFPPLTTWAPQKSLDQLDCFRIFFSTTGQIFYDAFSSCLTRM